MAYVIFGWGQRADMCGSYLLGCLRSPLGLSEDHFGLGLFSLFGLMQAQEDCSINIDKTTTMKISPFATFQNNYYTGLEN